MKTFKKVLEICAVEAMVGGGFFVVGLLCLYSGIYDGAAVSALAALGALVLGFMRWRKLSGMPAPRGLTPPPARRAVKAAKRKEKTPAKKKRK